MPLPDGFQDWAFWLALAIGLGVLELVSLDLILLMLAAGAIVQSSCKCSLPWQPRSRPSASSGPAS
jgi:membrane protein implicated in regulation of membrane protease activity